MPSLPPTLPSLRPCSHASCLPQLVVVLPLVLCCLSFLSCHRLPSGSASTCPSLVVLPHLVMPIFFTGVLASHQPKLFVMSPLVMPLPLICLHLHLTLHRHLSLRPSCVSCPVGCHVASHHTNASHPPAPPTLVVAPLLCLSSTLAGCRVASPHNSTLRLTASLPQRNSFQAVGLILIVKPNHVYNTRPMTMRRTL
jgi:hypothetical protein